MKPKLPTAPFTVTMAITQRCDGIFIECRLESGQLYNETGPFGTLQEARAAYDDLMDNVLAISGARLVTNH